VSRPGPVDVGTGNSWVDWYRSVAMRLVRRILTALFLAGMVASVLRVRGTGGTPPQHGGWRPLELPEQ